MFPKNKKGGVVTSTIVGVGALIIATIVILIVVQTLNDANLIGNDLTRVNTVTNESVALVGGGTGTIAFSTNGLFSTWNASRIINATVGPAGAPTNETLVEGADYQIFAGNGSFGNITGFWNATLVTYDWTQVDTTTLDAIANLTSNFTAGIDEVSLQIPTILLIVAVVFLFGALLLLIRSARTMGTEQSGTGSL